VDYSEIVKVTDVIEEASRTGVPVESLSATFRKLEVAPLAGPGATVADATQAVGYVVGAFGLINSRIREWQITIGDTIADNASCGEVVLGGMFRRLSDTDLALIAVILRRNGLVVDSGASGAVMGTLLAALGWLANLLAVRDESLCAGQVVLPGSLTVSVPASEGDTFEAAFSGFGSVAISFAGGGR
jgi:2-keto-4-pentenoate hydratase